MDGNESGLQVNQQIDAIESGGVAIGVQYRGLSPDEVKALYLKLKREDQPKVWNGRYPYLGLAAFQEGDAQYFYGREALVAELLSRLEQAPFICLAGPSGSGKSSLGQAGLLHALRSGQIEKSDTWLLANMQPKGDPFEQLAQALERATKSTQIGDAIRQNPESFERQVFLYLSSDTRQRLVLLVDQFEEIFTQTKEDKVQAQFIRLLTAVAKNTGNRITIILSVRSDFISHCSYYPELNQLINQQFQLVGAMSPQELTKAITLPALEAGVAIEPELVSRIMTDMKGQAGALPLMSFALRDMFEAEKTAVHQPMNLTLAQYLNRGGIEKALERHADRVFKTFTQRQIKLAQFIFTNLIDIQASGYTRRTATYEDIIPIGASHDEIEAVVNALAQAGVRLLTVSSETNSQTGVTHANVTIAHERLIDAWPWLSYLLQQNRDLIRMQNQINDDAKLWLESRDNGYLYRGKRLSTVNRYWDTLVPRLNQTAQRFIKASRSYAQSKIKEKTQQIKHSEVQAKQLRLEKKQREEAERQRKVIFRALVGGTVFFILMIAMIGYAANYWSGQSELLQNKNESLVVKNRHAEATSNALIAAAQLAVTKAWEEVLLAGNEDEKQESLANAAEARSEANAVIQTATVEAEIRIVEATNSDSDRVGIQVAVNEGLSTASSRGTTTVIDPSGTIEGSQPPVSMVIPTTEVIIGPIVTVTMLPVSSPTPTSIGFIEPVVTMTATPTLTPTVTLTPTPTLTLTPLSQIEGGPTFTPTTDGTAVPTETPTAIPTETPTPVNTAVPTEIPQP